MGEVLWIVKNPTTMKYNQFKDVYWQVISLFDGMVADDARVIPAPRRSAAVGGFLELRG